MQHTIAIRDELVLEAHPEGVNPHILLRREGEPGAVRIQVNEVRYLADAMLVRIRSARSARPLMQSD